MNTQDFINAVYDLIAQNPISGAYGMQGHERDYLTSLVDHVDTGGVQPAIMFKDPKTGKEFELRLIETYAPASYPETDEV